MDIKVLANLILCLTLATSTVNGQTSFDPTALDTQLSQITTNLIAEQSKIIQMLLNQTSIIQTANLTLTNVPDVVTALNTIVTIMTKQTTANNYANYQPITTCSDVNMKITSINFDVQKFLMLANKAYANATAIYQQNLWISYYYSLNLVALGIGSSKQQNVYNIIQQLNNIVVEYLTYTNQLLVAAGTEYSLGVQLSFFKQKYCSCPSTISTAVAGNVSTLDTNINFLEQPLITRQQKLISLSGTALGYVKSAIPAALQSDQVLQQTITFLTNLATISDYSQSPWTNTTSCSALLSRVGYVTYKYWVYVQAYASAAQNFSLTTFYQNNLNTSVMLYNSSYSATQYTAVVNAIQVMMIMENLYLDYLQKLAFTLNRLMHALLDIQALGDNFCACNSQGGTTVAATSTLASTTSSTTLTTTSTMSTTLAATTSTTLAPTTTSTTTLAPTTTVTTLASTSTTTEPPTTSTTLAPTTILAPTTTTLPPTTVTTTLAPTAAPTIPTTTTTTTVPPPMMAPPPAATTTTTVAPVITTTTTKAPPAICGSTYRILSSTGTYIKTLCYIKTAMNHAAATTYCTGLGMSLYAITDVDTWNGYCAFINSRFTTTPSFVSNGITSDVTKPSWHLFSNQTVPLYSGLPWVAPKITGQGCLAIYRTQTLVFTAEMMNCATLSMTFSCEYF